MTLSIILGILTVAFGLGPLINPKNGLSLLHLSSEKSTLGTSEIRAVQGGLVVFSGLAALYLGSPTAYFMLGGAYLGAAIGRLLSICVDRPAITRTWLFLALELVLGGLLVWDNLEALT